MIKQVTVEYISELKKIRDEFKEHKDPKQLNKDVWSLISSVERYEFMEEGCHPVQLQEN